MSVFVCSLFLHCIFLFFQNGIILCCPGWLWTLVFKQFSCRSLPTVKTAEACHHAQLRGTVSKSHSWRIAVRWTRQAIRCWGKGLARGVRYTPEPTKWQIRKNRDSSSELACLEFSLSAPSRMNSRHTLLGRFPGTLACPSEGRFPSSPEAIFFGITEDVCHDSGLFLRNSLCSPWDSLLLNTYILTSYAAWRREADPLDTKRTPTLASLLLQSRWKFRAPALNSWICWCFKKKKTN